MSRHRPLYLLFGGLAILAAAQILNHIQVQASTEKALVQAVVAQKLVAARDLKVSLERGLGLGKPLALFSGTDRLFSGLQARYGGIDYLAVAGLDGTVFAQTAPGPLENLSTQDLPVFPRTPDERTGGGSKILVRETLVLTALPLYFNDRDLVGTVWLGFSRGPLRGALDTEASWGLAVLGLVLTGSLAAFAGLFFLLERARLRMVLLTRLNLAFLGVLLASVGGYTLATSSRFTTMLVASYSSDVAVLVRTQAADWKTLLRWEVPPDHWKGAEEVLAAQIRHTPEAGALVITDSSGTVLYRAGRQAPPAGAVLSPGGGWIREPLTDGGGSVRAWLWSRVDPQFLDAIQTDRFLDALTVTLVSLIFSVELLLALGLLARVRDERRVAPASPSRDPASARGIKVIRFTAFLFFMAELLPLSFMPLFIGDLYTHAPLVLWGLSPDAVRGLPFSAHLLGVMIFVPLVGSLARRVSLRNLFLASGGLLLAGNLLAAFSDSLPVLMAYRFLSGLGYGGVLAASAGLVVQTTAAEHRTSGFAAWGAGFAAASICAVVLGGLLASYIGYRSGLGLSAVLSLLLGLFVFATHPKQPPHAEGTRPPRLRLADLFAPFRDRTALITLVFASLPVQLAFFGLFQYTLPMAMSQSGLSEANIGRVLTIYGLISLASPLLARYADRKRNERTLLALGNAVTGLVLCLFFFQSGLVSMILVVAAIGVGGLLFDTVVSSYLSMTKASARYGETQFLAVFLTWEKLFTVFVPVIVGSLMSAFGYLPAAAVLGAVITAGTLVFVLFGGRPERP